AIGRDIFQMRGPGGPAVFMLYGFAHDDLYGFRAKNLIGETVDDIGKRLQFGRRRLAAARAVALRYPKADAVRQADEKFSLVFGKRVQKTHIYATSMVNYKPALPYTEKA